MTIVVSNDVQFATDVSKDRDLSLAKIEILFRGFEISACSQTLADRKIRKFENSSSREECGMCRSRKMLKNAYLDAKIGVDTEENEPSKVL